MEIGDWFARLDRKYHIAVGLLLTLIIGYVDYVTGYELRMELFYLAPIAYVTWFVGQRVGVLFCVISLVTIFYSDIMAGKKYTSFTIEFWNGAMLFVFYVLVTLLLKLRISLQQRENLLEELDAALKQNQELTGLLPVCANCKKPRLDHDYLNRVEAYLSIHKAENADRLCEECSLKLPPGPMKERGAAKDCR